MLKGFIGLATVMKEDGAQQMVSGLMIQGIYDPV